MAVPSAEGRRHALFRFYAKFLDGLQEHANRLIEQSMQEWDRVNQGEAAAK